MAFPATGSTRPPMYRIFYIDKKIKAGQYPNCRNLAQELEVHPRTILRDIGLMKDSLGAPLEYDPKKRGFYYTEADYSLGLLKLTEGELLALCLGHNLLAKCKGTPYAKPVADAFNKICAYLQDTVDIDFGHLADVIAFDLEPFRGEEKQVAGHFSAIGKAIKQKVSIKLSHYSIAKDICRERLVDPYQLRYFQGAWYLVGFCHLRREVRIFALDRIRKLHLTTTPFKLPADFSPENYFRDAFQLYKGSDTYRIRIWFSHGQARYIREKTWHPTQEISENPDGSLVLSFQTSGLYQVKRWVLSFGSQAKVLEPPELVSAVAQEVAVTSQLYFNK
ncbi:MAG TPA: WYL domain-containing transcriptional regulator [Bacillota bacterium]|nr:WYL domain-containing transcriptional regulator [Bacillota bacterium]